MNAIGSFEAALPRAPFEAAREAAAAWRGRCLDLFARGEAAVTETLLLLAADDELGASIKLPHLVGQRYDSLSNAIGAEGAFADKGKSAASALERFRQHDALRALMAHGTFTVTLDHRGRWHIVVRVIALRAGRKTTDLLATEQEGAAEILATIEKDGARLRSTLGQLRGRLRAD